jgi:hypothetical protein
MKHCPFKDQHFYRTPSSPVYKCMSFCGSVFLISPKNIIYLWSLFGEHFIRISYSTISDTIEPKSLKEVSPNFAFGNQPPIRSLKSKLQSTAEFRFTSI